MTVLNDVYISMLQWNCFKRHQFLQYFILKQQWFNSLPTFIWDNKERWRQISRLRLRPFSTYIMENRIRHASGPVRSPILLYKHALSSKIPLPKNSTGRGWGRGWGVGGWAAVLFKVALWSLPVKTDTCKFALLQIYNHYEFSESPYNYVGSICESHVMEHFVRNVFIGLVINRQPRFRSNLNVNKNC